MNNAYSIANKFPSPLRYPGGKSALSNFFSKILELNSINGTYCEGYAGGAGAALHLLLMEKVERIILNDADIHIYSFWNSILNHCAQFIDKLTNCDITIQEWHKQRSIYENPSNYNEFEIGFSTFFLNRSNRGGILPNAGPTGGFLQQGSYKINARFNVDNLIPRIEKIYKLRNKIDFFNLDAIDFLQKIKNELDMSNSLIYLDPPYYKQGKNLYLNYYVDRNHSELCTELKNSLNNNWIVSYDNVKPIKDLYQDFRCCSFDINYSVQNSRKGKEIIFFSDALNIPQKLVIENRSYDLSNILCHTR